MESNFIVICIEVSLQYHLTCYTCNTDIYDVNVTLPSNIQVLYKLLLPQDQPLCQRMTALADAVVDLVCLAPTREFVRH